MQIGPVDRLKTKKHSPCCSVDLLPSKSNAETDMLDMAIAVEPNSRLSCQITCGPELDGIKLTIAPE